MAHRCQPQPQVNPRVLPRRGTRDRPRDQRDGPGHAHPAADGPVHQRERRFYRRDLEGRVLAAVVGNDVADGQVLPGRVDVADGPAPARQEALDRTGQIPACPLLAQLHDPRPHRRGRRGHRERPVHHHVGPGDNIIARPPRLPLPRSGGQAKNAYRGYLPSSDDGNYPR